MDFLFSPTLHFFDLLERIFGDDNNWWDKNAKLFIHQITERVETYLKNIQKISSNNEMIYIIPHHKNIIEEERR